MKILNLFTFFLLLSSTLYAQHSEQEEEDVWTSFWDEERELIGFKDPTGAIKIPAKFLGGGTVAHQFRNIIAVTEQTAPQTFESYYLLKDGRKVGMDSVLFRDNTPDCENEEKIRFHVGETDKIGFFNKNGEVAIPAIYNFATAFHNGLAVALKGAEKICHDGSAYKENNACEHWRWKGGQTLLIDEENSILIEDFEYSSSLDLFSIIVSEEDFEEVTRDFFQGTNGKYYSFINMEREFLDWFEKVFLNWENLHEASFEEITFWAGPNKGWYTPAKEVFLKVNHHVLLKKINQFKNGELDFFVAQEGLNKFIFEKELYAPYFDGCGNPKEWKYPLMTVVVSYQKEDYQDHISFLRTAEGYKLISLSLSSKKLK